MGAQPEPYQQFLHYMNAKSGRIFEIDFYQEQFGKRFESTGTFFYFLQLFLKMDADISFLPILQLFCHFYHSLLFLLIFFLAYYFFFTSVYVLAIIFLVVLNSDEFVN